MELQRFRTVRATCASLPCVLLTAAMLSGVAYGQTAADTSTNDDIKARLDALESTVNGLSNTTASKRELGLPIHGFSDVDFVHDTEHANGTQDGFVLGNFDLYMAPNLGGRMRALVELNFEYSDSGTLGTDLERLEYGYTFTDAFTLWMGRFHTPYGYWNTAFHHGTQMQLSTHRPRFLDFEDAGGILPAHSNGLNATGKWRALGGKFDYDLYVANGDRILDGTLDFNSFKDNNHNKLVGGNLKYLFSGRLDGLSIGVHTFTQSVASYNATTLQNTTKVNMLGAFAALETDSWQALAEYYHFNNHDDSGSTGSHSSWAGYAQVGYRIGTFTPYLRYEHAALDQADHYFADQARGNSYKRDVAGVRYDLNDNVAIKGEWSHTRDERRASDPLPTSWDALAVQLGVAF